MPLDELPTGAGETSAETCHQQERAGQTPSPEVFCGDLGWLRTVNEFE